MCELSGFIPKTSRLFVCVFAVWLYAHQQQKQNKTKQKKPTKTFRLSQYNLDFTSSTSTLHNTHALLVDLWSDGSAVLIKNSFGGLSPVGRRSKRQSERGAVRCCWRLMDPTRRPLLRVWHWCGASSAESPRSKGEQTAELLNTRNFRQNNTEHDVWGAEPAPEGPGGNI